MKKHIIIPLLILTTVFVALSSCRHGIFGCIRGTGPDITESRTISNFHDVEVQGSATVYLTEDSVYSFTATGQENLLRNMIISISDDKLIIKDRRCVRGRSGLVINIHAPLISNINVTGSSKTNLYKNNSTRVSSSKIKISGSGKITVNGTLNADNIYMEITGSGDIAVPLNALQTYMDITGSGSITAYGKTTRNDQKITGSGNIHSFDLESSIGYVDISGSGKSEITATDDLYIDISGSGSVHYRGWPRINTKISGSGKVVHEQ